MEVVETMYNVSWMENALGKGRNALGKGENAMGKGWLAILSLLTSLICKTFPRGKP